MLIPTVCAASQLDAPASARKSKPNDDDDDDDDDDDEKIEEFKDFLRPLHDFPVLFKAYLIFKDFSRKPYKFKYFSSLCKL